MRQPPAELVAVPMALPAAGRAPAGSAGRLWRNIAALASGQLVTWALTTVWVVFVPNRVGPRGMGEYGVGLAVANVLVVALGLGIGPLIIKEIARDHGRSGGLVGSAVFLRLVSLPVAVAAIPVYLSLTHSGSELSTVIWLSAGAAVVSMVANPLVFALQGLERMQYAAYSDVLTKAAVAFGGVTLVLFGFGIVPLMWLSLVLAALAAVLSWTWTRPYFRIDWRLNVSRIQFLAIGSLPYWTTGLVLTFYMWIDLLMLDRMAPIEVVGWYNVPTRLFATLLVVPTILSAVLLPRLARAFGQGSRAFAAQVRPALEASLVLSLPIAIGGALVSKQVIWVLYGYKFLPAVPVLSVLALCLPATYLNTMANQVLIAANRQVAWTKTMVAAGIANPLLNLVLIQLAQTRWHNGALGAALALLVTELGMSVAAVVLMPSILTLGSWLRILRAALATAGMGLVVWLVSFHSGLFVQVGMGMATFVTLGVLFRIVTDAEKAQLRRLPGMLRTR